MDTAAKIIITHWKSTCEVQKSNLYTRDDEFDKRRNLVKCKRKFHSIHGHSSDYLINVVNVYNINHQGCAFICGRITLWYFSKRKGYRHKYAWHNLHLYLVVCRCPTPLLLQTMQSSLFPSGVGSGKAVLVRCRGSSGAEGW